MCMKKRKKFVFCASFCALHQQKELLIVRFDKIGIISNRETMLAQTPKQATQLHSFYLSKNICFLK